MAERALTNGVKVLPAAGGAGDLLVELATADCHTPVALSQTNR